MVARSVLHSPLLHRSDVMAAVPVCEKSAAAEAGAHRSSMSPRLTMKAPGRGGTACQGPPGSGRTCRPGTPSVRSSVSMP